MARIPLQVAQRGLDTGSVVSYPSGSPIGDAMEGAGDALQAAAARVRQKQEQKDAFDATVRENEMLARISGLEYEAIQNAPADASGLHDSVYGEMRPDGSVAKPGSYDQLFDQYLAQIPDSKKSEFAAKREVYRLRGSNRLAEAQYRGEQAYYKVEIEKAENAIVAGIAASDPNDDQTFEAFKQQGLDLIDKSGLSALEKDVARYNWEANASEALFKSKLAKDPEFATQARAALGLAPEQPAGSGNVVDRIIGIESGGNATAKNPNSSATGAGQFISGTWMAMIRKYRPDIMQGRTSAQVLALRNDPALSREMTAAYAEENRQFLAAQGVSTSDGAIYLAHFLGPRGAVQILKANPGASAQSILGPDVIRANPFLRGKSASQVAAWAAKKMGDAKPASRPVDPRFQNIPLDRRLVLANQADVQVGEQERAAVALAKADYAAHKDALELQVVQGQIRDESLIASDPTLNDGDKATLIRSLRSQNETAAQISSDLAALNAGNLVLDAYSSKDRTRVDNAYSEAVKSVPADQQGALAGSIIEQTGVVPQPVINAMRRGLSSTNPAEVAAAMQTAQRIGQIDPAAIGRRDGGAEVQTAADDFAFYVNKLNLPPEEAARRLIEKNSNEAKFNRKALEPAAKEFLKQVEGADLGAVFDESPLPFNDPEIGFSEAQRLGIHAEFQAIAEDAFYATGGNPELALNRATETMKRLYGVTNLAGRRVVMKHPPERYWPAMPGSDPYGYVREQIAEELVQFIDDETITGWFPSNAAREAALPDLRKQAVMDSLIIMSTPETDAMVKAGAMPAYFVGYVDPNGNIQTVPGKLFVPDVSAVRAEADRVTARELEWAREDDAEMREMQDSPDGGRGASLDRYLDGPVVLPEIEVTAPPTLENRLDERRDELFRNARERGVLRPD